ncbi:MAG: hypothetical protein AAF560_15945 [Acidobacteriota bacterium]
MIEFVTLLLGLVTGVQAVEVSVDERIAAVELRLDGELVGTLDEPPWFLNCDFGEELAPRELSAVAYDAERREQRTIRQWVNVPRQRVEARLALDHRGSTSSARLIWTALDHQEPPQVRLTFDGRPLPVDDLEAIALPRHDLASLHFLRAELKFSETTRTHAEVVFGGAFGSEVNHELTAVVVQAGKRLPKPREMSGWFAKRGEPLEVVAVERGPVNLLVVRERSEATLGGLRDLWRQHLQYRAKVRVPSVRVPAVGEGDRVRMVFPTTGRQRAAVGGGVAPIDIEQVPVSGDLDIRIRKPVRSRVRARGMTPPPQKGFGSLFEALTRSSFSSFDQPAPEHQLSDALAIAGVVAATGDQRRAVVLIRSGDVSDTSRFAEPTVSGYLGKLQVPLVTWEIPGKSGSSTASEAAHAADPPDVSHLKGMHRALDALRKSLESQAVVWISGAHLAHEIELTERARGLEPLS